MSTRLNVSFNSASYTFLWPLRRQVFKLAGTMISEYCVPSEFMLTVHLFYLPFSSVGGLEWHFIMQGTKIFHILKLVYSHHL